MPYLINTDTSGIGTISRGSDVMGNGYKLELITVEFDYRMEDVHIHYIWNGAYHKVTKSLGYVPSNFNDSDYTLGDWAKAIIFEVEEFEQ